MRLQTTLASMVAVLVVAACSEPHRITNPSAEPSFKRSAEPSQSGAVYTMSNDPGANAVLAFRRASDGSLTSLDSYATGGKGTGGAVDPLVSQYSLRLTADHGFLLAVNAGSNDITSFRVASDGALMLTDRVSSGGTKPVSLALAAKIVYVLNTGNNTVSGFRLTPQGKLHPIKRSTRSLREGAAGASTIAFTPNGRWLIVTEIMANRLETFPVKPDGRLGDPTITASSGAGPFGFDVTPHNQPIVAEATGAAPNGAVSSYAVTATGTVSVVTPSLSTGQGATCWLVLTTDGRLAFTTNAMSGSISAFGVAENGALTLLDSRAGVVPPGAAPIDLDLAAGDRYLYVLEAGAGTIGRFVVGAGGTLTAQADTPAGVPASGMQGLAAW
jgi:6-phosphogluconolactonase